VRPGLPELLPLICPLCRRHSERGLELSSLQFLDGLLRCQGCGHEYAVAEGIPVLLREPAALLQLDTAEAVELAVKGPDDAPVPHAMAQLSSYLGAYESGFEELAAKLRGRPRTGLALELGCGVGRGLVELADGADLVVGLDRSWPMLRAAGTLLGTGALRYQRRIAGRNYAQAVVHAKPLSNVELICGDALNPPFAPGTFGRLVAFNLLDNVRSPRALLHHLSLLAAPEAELMLCSPYAWRDGIVDEGERLGGADPDAALREELAALGFRIEDDCELSWTLRHDARTVTIYQVHFIRARR
jgi:SAM-dependent methyltransferase